ncbi:MAG: peptide-methionine (S)-S-oxide reductase MsrA [Alphaproteobacteria bacterium]|nr:peptide-methionine (S)-S-oxide reductase MsrA [Alphaproteobacteria bacterium]
MTAFARWLFGFFAVVMAAASPAMAAPPAPARVETAVFAGGCFWCAEHDFAKIPGVIDVVSGYTGGTLANPTYEQVVTETTGHYESVRVTFDPARISYRQLVDRFWRLIDPTDAGGQFCDRGPSYRAAVFVTPAQAPVAEASRAAAAVALKRQIVTQIVPVSTFWPAEGYHQDFAEKNPVRYAFYRNGCGRDARIAKVWRGVK